jgi:hypothetical protein
MKDTIFKMAEDIAYIRGRVDNLPCDTNINDIKSNTAFRNKAYGFMFVVPLLISLVVEIVKFYVK